MTHVATRGTRGLAQVGRSLAAALWLAAGCSPTLPAPTPIASAPATATPAPQVQSVRLGEVQLDRAFYKPGEAVYLTAQLQAAAAQGAPARLTATFRHLTESAGHVEQDLMLTGAEQSVTLAWNPPRDAPRGYGVDLRLDAGTTSATASVAFDVLERWTQAPRYGFLTDFFPGRSDAAETMDSVTRYHINALQFYDWMYRHEQFLTDQEPYRDPLGRELSRATVDALIDAAHAHGIAAMPYTAVYGASVAFYQKHPDWALLKRDGQPIFFGDNFLVIMDPRPDSPWTAHLLDQFDQVLTQTAFDGIHLDQYGDPKTGYDANGAEFSLDAPLADFINATRARVDARRPGGAVVFNAVNNWPIEAVAPARQDIVYIEVWPPHNWFSDLHQLIVQAQALGGGKPVVLAAYIDPAAEYNVRLMDAVIFASGGGHIELGERNGLLADAYFPRYGVMSPALAEAIRRYYDFAVRYQEVIGPGMRDATRDYLKRVEIDGVSTAPSLVNDKVWPIVREGDGFAAVSLVNLLSLESPEWARRLPSPPAALGPSIVHIGVDREVSRVWVATPDGDDPSPQPLSFTQADGALSFQIPSLVYWDLIVIEWKQA